jgi:threonine/homoserine/homoserine lactone efflux protein
VGGSVLVYLGVSAWRSARRAGDDEQFGASLSLTRLPSGRTPAAAFRASLVTIAGIVLLAARARHWLFRAAIRRRLERALGATLIALGLDLAATAR